MVAVYLVYFLLSVALGSIFSIVFYGTQALRDCWSRTVHVSMLPAAFFLTIVQVFRVHVRAEGRHSLFSDA